MTGLEMVLPPLEPLTVLWPYLLSNRALKDQSDVVYADTLHLAYIFSAN